MSNPTRPRRASLLRRYDWDAYLYLLPALAFYAVFLLRPVFESGYISLYDWDGITASTFVGLGNYADVLTDPLIGEALLHSFVFIIFYALLPMVLALVFIGVIARVRVRGLAFYRAALFIPYILSTVVVAIAWRWIFAINGPLNAVLRAIGLGDLTRAWLGDFATALPSVGVIGTWIMFGLAFVLFLSGLQNVPSELFEAARLDGAGPVREFFAVTLPSLRGEIQVALVLMITAALRNFDIVWNTTSGGPGTSTTVPSYYIYREAFLTHHVGRASAIAIVLTVIIFAFVGLVMRLTRNPDTVSRKGVRA
ncbi:carbohydrate ABC transporter permease [Microbacterium sp. ASV49]|uniref:Sugar ABC transporter permease n=1 Tax=Microbacterium candidum TaxID=3041922 RepID=A0ABT7MU10_9MICO|nr:sugar ABC transporter permease [Microbacterium sp. ASV49]MDL9977933.1 sugar ABC transporter permease [Microbacterium sp. ASV49]